MTYAELQDQSQRLAGLMRQEGIGPGDRVALMVPNISAFPVACFNHPGEEHQPGSIGRAVRGCELQLVTPDGAVVPEDDEETLGEVWIRGENVMKGYWGKPEAAVVGVPHPELGPEVAAHVVLAPGAHATEEELIQHVKSQVAPYKYPHTVNLRDGLPKTATGKILKRELAPAE